jgi:hypothetical protein
MQYADNTARTVTHLPRRQTPDSPLAIWLRGLNKPAHVATIAKPPVPVNVSHNWSRDDMTGRYEYGHRASAGMGEFDDHLGWGGFLNPTNIIHQATAVARRVITAPVSLVRRQVADTRRLARASMPQNMLKAQIAFGAQHNFPLLNRGSSSSAHSQGTVPVDNTVAQNYENDQTQPYYAPQSVQAQPAEQPYYSPQSVQAQPAEHPYYAPQSVQAQSNQTYMATTTPTVESQTPSRGLDQGDVPDFSMFQSEQGADDMQMNMGNIPSEGLIRGPLSRSGMGDIWGDLMTTAVTAYGDKTQASIAQSQAAQAQAQQAAAAANAATLARAKQSQGLPWYVMAGLAVAGVGAIWYLKRRGGRR